MIGKTTRTTADGMAERMLAGRLEALPLVIGMAEFMVAFVQRWGERTQ